MADLSELQLNHEGRLAHCESWIKQHQEDIERLERAQENIQELIKSVSTIAQKQTDMDTKVDRVERKMEDISARQGKRWETVVDNIIRAIVVGLVGYVLIKLGIG